MPGAQSGQIIQVKVKLFGHLKQITQQAVFDMETPAGSSVAQVIHEFAQQQGNDFNKALMEQSGNLHGGIEIILNHEHLPARRINKIYIFEDCELFIMPMIEGG
jgi:molybdopterin converting factor small subunit